MGSKKKTDTSATEEQETQATTVDATTEGNGDTTEKPSISFSEAALQNFQKIHKRVKEQGVSRIDTPGFIIGAEWGFDPVISIEMPGLMDQALIDSSLRSNDVFGAGARLFGEDNFPRIIAVLDQVTNEHGKPIGGEIFGALVATVADAFFGKGYLEAPGGSRAS